MRKSPKVDKTSLSRFALAWHDIPRCGSLPRKTSQDSAHISCCANQPYQNATRMKKQTLMVRLLFKWQAYLVYRFVCRFPEWKLAGFLSQNRPDSKGGKGLCAERPRIRDACNETSVANLSFDDYAKTRGLICFLKSAEIDRFWPAVN